MKWPGGRGGGEGTVTPGPQMWDVVPELGLGSFRQQGLIKVSDWLPALLVDKAAPRFAFISPPLEFATKKTTEKR